MLSDGTKAIEVEDTVGTYDIAEILEVPEQLLFDDKFVC